MNISDNGIEILKRLEGCVVENGLHIIYDDQTGRAINPYNPLPRGATIGYGHLIKPGEDFSRGIDESRATELLRADVKIAERTVQKSINTTLTQNQFDALVIFAYNIGENNFIKSSVVKFINNPNYKSQIYPDLKSAWLAWNKSNGRVMAGLTNRRKTEFNLFNK